MIAFLKSGVYDTRMKKLILLTILSTFLFACSSNKSKEYSLSKAEEAYAAGDYPNAVTQLLPLAKEGNPQAQYTLGYMYYYGQGVAKDRTQGYFWMQQSAKQGNRSALQALELLNQGSRKGAPTTANQ